MYLEYPVNAAPRSFHLVISIEEIGEWWRPVGRQQAVHIDVSEP